MINNKTVLFIFALATLVIYAGIIEAQRTTELSPIDTNGPVTYFIAEGSEQSHYKKTDHELAMWALRAWEKKLR